MNSVELLLATVLCMKSGGFENAIFHSFLFWFKFSLFFSFNYRISNFLCTLLAILVLPKPYGNPNP